MAVGRYLDRPLLVGSVPTMQVTFESPAPVPRAAVVDASVTHFLHLDGQESVYLVTNTDGNRVAVLDPSPVARLP